MRYKLLLIMQVLSRRFWYQTGRVRLTALLVLVALALLVQTSVPAHVHSDGEPGIYNAQCPLAASATAQRAYLLSAVSVAGWKRAAYLHRDARLLHFHDSVDALGGA